MCGCTNCAAITSTRGEKGDTGAAGGTFRETLYTQSNLSGIDIYAAGTGLELAVLPSKTGGGTLSYDGVVYVEATDVGVVRLTPANNGSAIDAGIVRSTYPAAFAGKSYISIPISGTTVMTDGTAFTITVLGTAAINAKMVSANIKLKEY